MTSSQIIEFFLKLHGFTARLESSLAEKDWNAAAKTLAEITFLQTVIEKTEFDCLTEQEKQDLKTGIFLTQNIIDQSIFFLKKEMSEKLLEVEKAKNLRLLGQTYT